MQEQNTPSPTSFLAVLNWSEEKCREYIAEQRWPDGVCCPTCGSLDPYRCTRKTPSKNRVKSFYKCRECKRQFTATVGTILEDTKAPLSKWLAAFYLMCASKKGISSHQLHRMLDVTYNTAWYMSHRIRHAMKDKGPLLSGIIEADETYVGGKPRGHVHERTPGRQRARVRGGIRAKTPVFGILERGGRVRPIVMPGVNKDKVESALAEHVRLADSVLMTDESKLYRNAKEILPHSVVKHAETYVTGKDIHTQGIEGFWSRLKRQLYGTHHHVQAGFLGMYVDECAFKHNTRNQSDAERFDSALASTRGRLNWRGNGAA